MTTGHLILTLSLMFGTALVFVTRRRLALDRDAVVETSLRSTVVYARVPASLEARR